MRITDLDKPDPSDRHRNPIDDQDRDDREQLAKRLVRGRGRPRKVKPAWAIMLGDRPVLRAGDHQGALRFARKIDMAIDEGGWTASERSRLYKLRDRWRRRAEGKDHRFNLVGTRVGRMTEDMEAEVLSRTRRDAQREPKPDGRRKRYDLKDFEDPTPDGFAGGLPSEQGDASADLDGDAGDDELGAGGDVRKRPLSDRDFLVPGTDAKGHAHRVQCRLMPAHFRALSALKDSKLFPFATLGDIVRWSIARGIEELQSLRYSSRVNSHWMQYRALQEIAVEEQAQAEFASTWDALNTVIMAHVSAHAMGEARRVAALVKQRIEAMPEGYWRDKNLTVLRERFGYLLDGNNGEAGVPLA